MFSGLKMKVKFKKKVILFFMCIQYEKEMLKQSFECHNIFEKINCHLQCCFHRELLEKVSNKITSF